MRNSITARPAAVLFVMAAAVFCGCFKPDVTDPAATPSGQYMFVFTAPAATAALDTIDVVVDDVVLGTGVRYLATTGYLPAPAGSHTLKLQRSRGGATLLNATYQLDVNARATVFAVDSVSKMSLLTLADTLTVPDSGKANIRIVHLSPNTPAVDVTVVNAATDSVTVLNRNFKDFARLTVPSSSTAKTIRVKLAGTSTVLLTTAQTLASKRIYTLYIRGLRSATGTSALGATLMTNL